MIRYNTLVVLAGVGLLGVAAGVVGSFAVLRRRALLGDALAHAALPGLCLGFLVLGERHLVGLLLGALATGLLGITTVSLLSRWTRVREDAAIGIVLSVFVGAGIVLGRIIQNETTTGSKAGLDSYILGKTAGMVLADVILIGGTAAGCVGLVGLLFKEFLLVTFDLEFAIAQGWPARWIDLVLTGLVAVVVVVGLPAVGVVLIAALLILPGAAARFWTDRLSRLILIAAVLGAGMGLIGTALSAAFERMPAGPIITLVGSGLFFLSGTLAPRRGLVARILSQLRVRRQAHTAELLRLLFEFEQGGISRTIPELLAARSWSPARVRSLLAAAARAGTVVPGPHGWSLTPTGRPRAVDAVRQHRLWRLLVEDYPDLASLARPLTGDRIDEHLPGDIVAELTARLKATGRWPEVVS